MTCNHYFVFIIIYDIYHHKIHLVAREQNKTSNLITFLKANSTISDSKRSESMNIRGISTFKLHLHENLFLNVFKEICLNCIYRVSKCTATTEIYAFGVIGNNSNENIQCASL